MVLPDDVWLLRLSGQPPTLSTSQTGPVSSSAAAASSAAAGGTTPSPESTDLNVMFLVEGFTYSQSGVARLMSRMSVVPDFEHVQLLSSTRADQSGRAIYHFRVGADIRQPGDGS
jgi:hypothetical protein